MDILDFCHYQHTFEKPCPFKYSTCYGCPWSAHYRLAFRSRDLFAGVRCKVVDCPCYYRYFDSL